MSTYVALTTTNYKENGYHVVAEGSSKPALTEQAKNKICGVQKNTEKDISTETELKNLIVVSKTAAKRRYGIDIDSTDYLESLSYAERPNRGHTARN